MKKKILAALTALVMTFTAAAPVFAAPTEPALALGNVFGASILQSDRTFTYDFTVKNTGGAIDANSLEIVYNENVDAVTLTNPASYTGKTTGTAYKMYFNTASSIEAGSYKLSFTLNYKLGGADLSKDVEVPLTVGASASDPTSYNKIVAENLSAASEKVLAGASASVAADVINAGTAVSDLVVTVTTSGGTVLARKYIGKLDADALQNVALDFTAPATSGINTLYYTINYKGSNGVSYNNKTAFTLNVAASTPLTLQNLVCPAKVIVATDNQITFNLINTGNEDYLDVQAGLYLNGSLLATNYIGSAAAHASTAGTLTFHLNNVKKYELVFKLTYTNSAGTALEISRAISITGTSETVAAQTGGLKIQSIDAPVYAQKDAKTDISFSVTNPTSAAVTGAEAYIYDADGNAVDSIYISSLEANSSTPLTMSITPTAVGKSSYKLCVYYLDGSNSKQTISQNFSTTVKTEVGTGDAAEKPASLKVASVDAPAVIYTNVKTAIPFAVVNAGKGTAYNVEVYVVDENGTEIARDYIGSISSSTKQEGSIKLKFTEAASHTLKLCFSYENFDETAGSASKEFDGRVADYRISITDFNDIGFAVEGEPTTLTFSVSNMGAMDLLNTNATLSDENGNLLATSFVGTIGANTKSENLKFKKVSLPAGSYNIIITLDYENSDGEAFSAVSAPVFANVMTYDEAYGGGGGVIIDDPSFSTDDPNVSYDEYGNPIEPSTGVPFWGWILISVGAAAVIAVVVIIVVKHKKKASDENDDMEYFYRSAPETKPSEQEQDKK